MTEEEWLENSVPEPMLEFLRGQASDRKLRLFASGCCRRLSSHFKDERSQEIVEVSDKYSDKTVGLTALEAAFDAAADAQEAIHWEGGDAVDQSAAEAVLGLRNGLELGQVLDGAWEAAGAIAAGEALEGIYSTQGRHWSEETQREHDEATRRGEQAERNAQSGLLRDIFGNPFQPKPTMNRSWLTWNGGTIVKLAQAIYEQRAFERLPVLADALEEAGCTDDKVLGHCRGAGSHTKGCWVVDLVLGKE